jgi:hypothetical protein
MIDLEKAVEFLLESQAKHDAKMQAIEGHVQALSELVENGTNLLVKYQQVTDNRFQLLIESRVRTEENLARLADAHLRLAEAQGITAEKLLSLVNSALDHTSESDIN